MLTTQFKFLPVVLAGFPSPADDYLDEPIDFNEYFGMSLSSVMPLRVMGNSMEEAHLPHNSIVVVDKSVKNPLNNSIVIVTLNGENLIKHLVRTNDGIFLLSANPKYKSIRVTEDMDFSIWGTVKHIIIDL